MFGFKLTDYDKKVYEEELCDFLPETIVDSHTHVYKKENKKEKTGPVYWPSRVAEDCTLEDIEKTYLDLFPGKKVIPVMFGNPESNIELDNAYISEKARETGYPALLLTHYDMSEEYLERAVTEGGFQGLKPYLNNCRRDVCGADAGIFDFLPHHHLKLADKYGWKVVLHISRPERLKDKQNIRDLMEIEEKYPNVKLVVAHIGRAYAPEDLGDAFDTLRHTKNMKFDFCANTLPVAIEKCIEAVGTKRVLFGTDMPIAKMRMYRISEDGYYINVVPRGLYGDLTDAAHMRESDEKNITNFTYEIIRAFKTAAKELKLTKEDVENIMCNNAKELYGIRF